MGTNSHGLYYEETKKPWVPNGSPMAPCYYGDRLRGMDEPLEKRRKRNSMSALYVRAPKVYYINFTI